MLQQLGEYYDVKEIGGSAATSSSWLVEDKGNPRNLVGNVYFRSGKLSSVYKYWTVSEPDTEAAFANALYGAVRSFEQEGRTDCTIQTAHKQEPNFEDRVIFLTCGPRYVRIEITKDKHEPESAQIIEVLELPRNK